jgi:hypothetical protein
MDLFADALGFRRVLMRDLDNDFHSFDPPIDSAVVSTLNLELSW